MLTGAGALAASARMAQDGSKESSTKAEHWVEFAFVDTAGNPVCGLPYVFTGPDGTRTESVLQQDGKVRRDELPRGECKVRLLNVFNARWSGTTARVGEPVKLSANVEGFRENDEATFIIYKRDINRPDQEIARRTVPVRGKALEAEWEYPASTKTDEAGPEENAAAGYSSPEFYFDVSIGPCRTHSPILRFEGIIVLTLKDEKGNPLANAEYVLRLPDGSMRRGKVNGQGLKKEEKVAVGRCTVVYHGQAHSQQGA